MQDTSRPSILTIISAWRQQGIAALSLGGIGLHLVLWLGLETGPDIAAWPLLVVLVVGGLPLTWELLQKALRAEFGADLLGGISIVTAVLLQEYLAGAIIVLMLSGGEVLESYAVRSASAVLTALAARMPQIAHRQQQGELVDLPVEELQVGDEFVVFPHELCPADGVVTTGHGWMDESFLTGEPYQMTKTVGSTVISGAINGSAALTIQATRPAADSRYARIMRVMQQSEQTRPRLRRLGDQLGAWYTPLALIVAGLAWGFSGEAVRFLAVLVIATPCPLLIAIPVSIIGSISLAARRSIIVKDPVTLEQVTQCRTAIFDKTGTLTHGRPTVTEILPAAGIEARQVLQLAASAERYSKHPLAAAILRAAEEQQLELLQASHISEPPGQGMQAEVDGQQVQLLGRGQLQRLDSSAAGKLPEIKSGLECVVLLNGRYAALLRFRDAPRRESRLLIDHLGPRHQFERVMIVSGDRAAEVQQLAEDVGIEIVYADQQPEEKLAIVRAETIQAKTLYVGDGINDAPAMLAATVGIALGQNSDVTGEAAGVVILDHSLEKVDEFLHIGRRMRTIALQSAGGGMLLSLVGMGLAAAGYLNPVQGALCQEVIDVLAVLNALRAAWPAGELTDMQPE